MDARWTIKISEETDRSLRMYLAQSGAKKGGLSRFVEEAVQDKLYQLTVEEIQSRNADLTEDELEEIVEDAVKWARKAQ